MALHIHERNNVNQERIFFPLFDWLRFSLSIVIVLSHLGVKFPHFGTIAVSCFLVLSGFVVGTSILKIQKEELPKFFLGRFIRIWIPYFISILLLVFASLLHHDQTTAKWIEFVIYKLTFVYNLFGEPQIKEYFLDAPLQGTGSHFWSLSSQEQLYLFLPVIFALLPKIIVRSPIAWAILAVISWWFTAYTSLVFGILVALSFHSRKELVHPLLSGTLFLVSVYCLYFSATDPFKLLPFIALSIVLIFMRYQGARHPVGALLGAMSFQMYMNAWIATFLVNFAIKRFGVERGAFTITLAVFLSILISFLMYCVIDKNLIKYKKNIAAVLRADYVAMFMVSIIVGGVCYGIYMTDSKPFLGY